MLYLVKNIMKINREDLNNFLQHVECSSLKELADVIVDKHNIQVIQKPNPQTLLVPVHDPVSSTEFYAGEVLVTAAVVKVEAGNGWGMVMDDNGELALQIAILDGAWDADLYRDEIAALVEAGRIVLADKQTIEQEKVSATRVNFDLL